MVQDGQTIPLHWYAEFTPKKGEKIEFQTPEITATFYKRKKDAKWKADFVGTEKDKPATTWFTTVPEPAPKMTEV